MILNQSPPSDNTIDRTGAIPADKIRRAVAVGALLNRVRWFAEVGFLTYNLPHCGPLTAKDRRRAESLMRRIRTLVRRVVRDVDREAVTRAVDTAAAEFRSSLEGPGRYAAFAEAIDEVREGVMTGGEVVESMIRTATSAAMLKQWLPWTREGLWACVHAAVVVADGTGVLSKAMLLGRQLDQGFHPDDVTARVFASAPIDLDRCIAKSAAALAASNVSRTFADSPCRPLWDWVREVLVNHVPRPGETPPAPEWLPIVVTLCDELHEMACGITPVYPKDLGRLRPGKVVRQVFSIIDQCCTDPSPASNNLQAGNRPGQSGPRIIDVDAPSPGWPSRADAAEKAHVSKGIGTPSFDDEFLAEFNRKYMGRLQETEVGDIDVLDNGPDSDILEVIVTVQRAPILESDYDDPWHKRRWERKTPPWLRVTIDVNTGLATVEPEYD